MGVEFGRFYIGMTHEFLDDADVDAVFQYVGGEGMPEGVTAHAFGDGGSINRRLDRFLQTRFEHVVPTRNLKAGIHAQVF